jgi:hypothetical protein
MPLQPFYVLDKLLSVRDPAGHMNLQGMTRNDFHADIGFIFVEKILKFSHIIKHERVFAELDFY